MRNSDLIISTWTIIFHYSLKKKRKKKVHNASPQIFPTCFINSSTIQTVPSSIPHTLMYRTFHSHPECIMSMPCSHNASSISCTINHVLHVTLHLQCITPCSHPQCITPCSHPQCITPRTTPTMHHTMHQNHAITYNASQLAFSNNASHHTPTHNTSYSPTLSNGMHLIQYCTVQWKAPHT
jgi:hypothetical protein